MRLVSGFRLVSGRFPVLGRFLRGLSAAGGFVVGLRLVFAGLMVGFWLQRCWGSVCIVYAVGFCFVVR